MTDISKKCIFRILHKDNLEYILKNGLFAQTHASFDNQYINIGDSVLIAQRTDYPVRIQPPGGFLGNYVPFYFATLTPMLLNIKTGYRGIEKRQQSDIVYICCKLKDIIASCQEWCFTDGHAKSKITHFYNSVNDLDKIDWTLVNAKYWKNTEEDFDIMRRKQAEFLVKNYVPSSCISSIVVHDLVAKIYATGVLSKIKVQIPVEVNPQNKFYL